MSKKRIIDCAMSNPNLPKRIMHTKAKLVETFFNKIKLFYGVNYNICSNPRVITIETSPNLKFLFNLTLEWINFLAKYCRT